jgi:PKD repeat protein/Cu/Zn superoxide dismutase
MRRITVILFCIFIFPAFTLFAQNKINNYEYWFDNNYAGKTDVNITPVDELDLNAALATSGVSVGLHMVHIRARDNSNHYSATLSQFFQKLPSSTSSTKQIVAYEYWFDTDYASKVYSAVSPQSTVQLMNNLDASSLQPGLHAFHIRFKDDGGGWSTVESQFIQKVSGGTTIVGKIKAYEYWFDNDYANKKDSTVAPQSALQLISNLDATALPAGLHVFHIRFKDDGDTWSSVLSQFIQKVSGGTLAANKINAYEYWFDDNYSGKVFQTVTAQSELQLIAPLGAQSLTNGLHVFHLRFKDIGNSWSAAASSFFQKFEQSPAISNLITGYRYWFDLADSVMYNTQLTTPVDLYSLNNPLDLSGIHKGNHIIHFQFLDTLKNWSCVTSDSMYKYPTVHADFTQNNSIVCDSGLVSFTNISFDADTFKWVFDDGTTSNLMNPTHFFNTYGTHAVKLIAMDTTESVKDSLTLNVFVAHSPVVNIGSDTTVCPPGIALNAWNPNCSYLWSNSSTDSLIHVNSAGQYYVMVINQYGCSASDSINILINPAPVVYLGNDTTICTGSSIILNAGSGFASYDWSTGATSQTITVDTSGVYSVEVINSYGCSAIDSIHVFLDPCTGTNNPDVNYFVNVYPNPAHDRLTIEAPQKSVIEIYNIAGQIIKNIVQSDDKTIIDISDFPGGIYFVKLVVSGVEPAKTGSQIVMKKFIKQ